MNFVDVIGLERLKEKVSAVDAKGNWLTDPIEGLVFRPTRPVPHEDGHVTEVARTDWDAVCDPIVQVHTTTTIPGCIRAWGLHRLSTDRLFVVKGLVKIVVFDGRADSKTKGNINEFTVSERNPGLLVIAPNLYHGWKNIGVEEAVLINMPTRNYNYDGPDALDLPYDSEDAVKIVPFRF